VEYLFEPELIDLVDDDKKQFIVLRAMRAGTAWSLNIKQFVQPQVT